MATVKINIDNRTIIRIMIVVVLFALALRFLDAVQQALTLVLISAFLAVALNPPVSFFAQKIFRGNRVVATGIAYLMVLMIIGVFLWALIPPLVRQSGIFLENVPTYVDQVTNGDHIIGEYIDRYELDQEIEEFGSNLANRLGDANGPLLSGLGRAGEVVISILTVLVLTFFMLIEGPYWIKKFWEFQHPDHKKHRQELAEKMYHAVTGYVNGQLLVALLAGFTALVVMLLVGIPFALPLAGVVALFGLVPLVGATIGSVVVILVALFQSVAAAVIMAVFFLVYQQIENNVVQPMVQSKTLDLSPLMVLIAVIFGITVGGILGGFIAIPTAAILKILFLDYNKRRMERIAALKKKKLERQKAH